MIDTVPYFEEVGVLAIAIDNDAMDFTLKLLLFLLVVVHKPLHQARLAESVLEKNEADLHAHTSKQTISVMGKHSLTNSHSLTI